MTSPAVRRLVRVSIGLSLLAACSATTTSHSSTPVGTAPINPALSNPALSSTAPSSTAPISTGVTDTALGTTVPAGQTTTQPSAMRCAPPTDGTAAAAGSGPVRLDMWSVLNSDDDETLRAQILNFNKNSHDVEISLSYTGTSSEVVTKLSTGDRPDLLAIGSEALVNLTDAGLVTAAAGCIANDPGFRPDDLLPVAAATYQLDHQQVAVPITLSTPLLYFDRDRFLHAGLDPDHPPRTLAELRSALQTMLDTHTATQGLTYANASWFVTQWAAQLGVQIGSGDNGHALAPGASMTVSLDDPGLRASLAELRSMADAGLIMPPISNVSGYEDLALLIAPDNTAAMALHTSGSLSRVYKLMANQPNVAVGVGPLPGPGVGGLVGGAALWITTPDPDKVWPTWSAIRYFTDAAQQADYGALGYAPLRLSSLDDPDLQAAWAERPGLRLAFDQLQVTNADPSHLSIAAGAKEVLLGRLDRAGQDIIDVAQKMSVDAALDSATTDINTYLGTYNSLHQ